MSESPEFRSLKFFRGDKVRVRSDEVSGYRAWLAGEVGLIEQVRFDGPLKLYTVALLDCTVECEEAELEREGV